MRCTLFFTVDGRVSIEDGESLSHFRLQNSVVVYIIGFVIYYTPFSTNKLLPQPAASEVVHTIPHVRLDGLLLLTYLSITVLVDS